MLAVNPGKPEKILMLGPYPRPIKPESQGRCRQEIKTFRRITHRQLQVSTSCHHSVFSELSHEMIWGKNKGHFPIL